MDVYRVTFSSELAGNLTTSGLCHVKFWKMASTFTGLKLKGNLGRFGKTELSDIEAYTELADGKVVSGSEWGNLLVWENGLIVAEICTVDERPCHKGIVRQIFINDGDFLTTGQDGHVRVWNHDAIDTSEVQTTEHSNKVSLRPMADVCINESADIWYLVNEWPDAEGNISNTWLAQDGKGVVWSVDLSFLQTAKEPKQVFTSHGGAIVGCELSQTAPLVASICKSGEVRVENYQTKELMASRRFGCAGSCLSWPKMMVDLTGSHLVAGFEDGSMRVLSLSRVKDSDNKLPMSILLEMVCKPHSRAITSIAFHDHGYMMATGSLDGTIFFFDVLNEYKPMAFGGIPLYKPVLSLFFEHKMIDDHEEDKIVAAVEGGKLYEMLAPDFSLVNNVVSYYEPRVSVTRVYEFASVKSRLLHELQLEQERKEAEKKQIEMDEQNKKLLETGAETQEEQNLRLLLEADEAEIETKKIMEERKKWRPYIPPEPSPILFMMQLPFKSSMCILSMGKYDAGYLYLVERVEEAHLEEGGQKIKEPIASIPIPDHDDVAVNYMCFSADGARLFMGFEDGRIRVHVLYSPFNIETLGPYWQEGIHDCVRGNITSLVMDKRSQFLFSTAMDGNMFMFCLYDCEFQVFESFDIKLFPNNVQKLEVRDNVDRNTPTLELFKAQEKELYLLAEAKKNKAAKREKINHLRVVYNDLVKRNKELPEGERLSRIEFAITSDNADRKKNDFEQAKYILEKTIAWECEKCSIALNKMKSFYKDTVNCNLFVLKAFKSDIVLSSFRIAEYPAFFESAKERLRTDATPPSEDTELSDDDDSSKSDLDDGLPPKPRYKKGMCKFVHRGNLRRWQKKKKRSDRRRVWHHFYKTEPTDKDLVKEDQQIENAIENIGYMKLKTDDDYKEPEHLRLTTNRLRKALIRVEETLFNLKSKFNKRMRTLREYKIQHIDNMKEYEQKLRECREDLPLPDREPLPSIPTMGREEDPDCLMKYTKKDIEEMKIRLEKQVKRSPSAVGQQKKTEGKGPMKRALRKYSVFQQQSSAHITQHSSDRDLGSFVESVEARMTPLEEEILSTKIAKAEFNQKYYLSLIEKEMCSFDAKLKLLRHRKVHLDYIVKMADARMVSLTQKFLIVSGSEKMTKHSNNIKSKMNKEKKEILTEQKGLNKKMEAVKKVLDGFSKQRLALQAEVVALAKEKCPQYEKYLIRVFKKKFQKPKEKRAGSDGSGSDSEESSSDDDMDFDESDEDDDGLDIDLPPSDLAKAVYEGVVAIRERRRLIGKHLTFRKIAI